VLARGVIAADGTLESGTNILDSRRDSEIIGRYFITASLAGAQGDLSGFTPEDYPVLVTLRQTTAGPGGGGVAGLLIAQYLVLSVDLEAAPPRLEVRVDVRRIDGELNNAAFSILVLEP